MSNSFIKRSADLGTISLVLVFFLVLFLNGPAASAQNMVSVEGTVTAGGEPVKDAHVLIEGVPESLADEYGQEPLLDQKNKEFRPHVLTLWTGREITIKNSDSFFHDLVLTDLEYFRGRVVEGDTVAYAMTTPKNSTTKTFEESNVLKGTCNPHPEMLTYLLVREEPVLYAKTDENGQFSLEFPKKFSGTVDVLAWTPDRWFTSGQEIDIGDQETIDVSLSY